MKPFAVRTFFQLFGRIHLSLFLSLVKRLRGEIISRKQQQLSKAKLFAHSIINLQLKNRLVPAKGESQEEISEIHHKSHLIINCFLLINHEAQYFPGEQERLPLNNKNQTMPFPLVEYCFPLSRLTHSLTHSLQLNFPFLFAPSSKQQPFDIHFVQHLEIFSSTIIQI